VRYHSAILVQSTSRGFRDQSIDDMPDARPEMRTARPDGVDLNGSGRDICHHHLKFVPV
jgi:hypothetical protein